MEHVWKSQKSLGLTPSDLLFAESKGTTLHNFAPRLSSGRSPQGTTMQIAAATMEPPGDAIKAIGSALRGTASASLRPSRCTQVERS